MLLASQGLPRGGQQGADVLTAMPLGASRAVEAERIRSAREADLARTIEAIDAVQTARVHLAVEQPSVFVRDAAPCRRLGDADARRRPHASATMQVQAIVNLVASSVPGLVARGRLGGRPERPPALRMPAATPPPARSERQLAVQNQVEDRYRQAITSLLRRSLGADNFTTEVHAEMDFSEVQSTREGFPAGPARADQRAGPGLDRRRRQRRRRRPPAAFPARSPTSRRPRRRSPRRRAARSPPSPRRARPPTAGAARRRADRTENYNRDFAVGREVSVTHQQTGTVKRLSVAVALRNPDGRPRGLREIQQLEELVKGAVGFDQARGDVVAINSRTFATAEEPTASWWEASWVSMVARNLTALVVAGLLIFGLGKPLLKKGTKMLANRAENRSSGRVQGLRRDRHRARRPRRAPTTT